MEKERKLLSAYVARALPVPDPNENSVGCYKTFAHGHLNGRRRRTEEGARVAVKSVGDNAHVRNVLLQLEHRSLTRRESDAGDVGQQADAEGKRRLDGTRRAAVDDRELRDTKIPKSGSRAQRRGTRKARTQWLAATSEALKRATPAKATRDLKETMVCVVMRMGDVGEDVRGGRRR